MVGVPGRSKSCNTCKKRKKGVRRAHTVATAIAYYRALKQCDRLSPTCSQCLNAGLLCTGYSRSLTWVGNTLQDCTTSEPQAGAQYGPAYRKQRPWNVSYSRSATPKILATVPDARNNENTDTCTSETLPETLTLRARAPSIRRGYFKSRLGCLNCKRRRIKCDELHPRCAACYRMGLTCAYSVTSPLSPTVSPSAARSLSSEDMLFYHQFLTVAYPPLPLRRKELWIQVASTANEVSHTLIRHRILLHQVQGTNL